MLHRQLSQANLLLSSHIATKVLHKQLSQASCPKQAYLGKQCTIRTVTSRVSTHVSSTTIHQILLPTCTTTCRLHALQSKGGQTGTLTTSIAVYITMWRNYDSQLTTRSNDVVFPVNGRPMNAARNMKRGNVGGLGGGWENGERWFKYVSHVYSKG